MIKLSSLTSKFLNILFLFIAIYVFQDLINSKNVSLVVGDRVIVHVLLVIIIILICLYNILYNLKVSIHIDSIQLSLISINIWILLVNIFREVPIRSFFVHFGLSLLWIMSYKFSDAYFSYKYNNNKQFYRRILFILCMYVFGTIYAKYNISRIDGRIPVLNLIYYVLGFIPWITLTNDKRTSRIFNSIILILVMLSLKRGAIIIYVIMNIAFFVVRGIIERRNLKSFVKIFLFGCLFALAVTAANYFTDGFLLDRFSNDAILSGSGRNELYNAAIANIKQRDFFDMLVGFGSGSSVEIIGNGVHNEWLEFLFSYGLIGTLLYFIFIGSILRESYYLIKNRSKYATALAQATTLVTFIGLFDGFYFMHSTLYVMLFFGAISGIKQRIRTEGLNYE